MKNTTMTTDEIVTALDALVPGDAEAAHSEADALLLAAVPEAVADAWQRASNRIGFWYA